VYKNQVFKRKKVFEIECELGKRCRVAFLTFCCTISFGCSVNPSAQISGVPRNFIRVGGSTNSVEDRENGDLGAVAP
jgi:hypothetical protein